VVVKDMPYLHVAGRRIPVGFYAEGEKRESVYILNPEDTSTVRNVIGRSSKRRH
jgi:hypothetical protein